MISIALSKGRILDEALPLLKAAGIVASSNPDASRKLIIATSRAGVRLIIVRATDVPTYVQYGAADLGIAGGDVLMEYGSDGLYQPLDLGIARCRLMVAVRKGFDYERAVRQGARLRVATKYLQTARAHFAAKGVHVDLIKLYGSMELAPLTGLADAIVDLVSTGNTLKANHLVAVEEIAQVSARLIVNQAAYKLQRAAIQPLLDAFARSGEMIAIARLKSGAPDFEARLSALLAFEAAQDPAVDGAVADILTDVKKRGDAAVLDYTRRFDRNEASSVAALEITRDDMQRSLAELPPAQRSALEQAAARVRAYHEKQLAQSWSYTEADGTRLGQQVTALDRVGIYVPGGKAAYPSSVLMNALPARVAGVGEIVMVVPTPDGRRNPLVLAAAALAGVDRAFAIGGAQAIGALAYGTQTVPQVDKIVGPGNAYVAAAKRRVFGVVGIDMIAGPSEILIISDGGTDSRLDRNGYVCAGRARRTRAGDAALAGCRVHRGGRGEHRAPACRDAAARRDQSRAGKTRRLDRGARPR